MLFNQLNTGIFFLYMEHFIETENFKWKRRIKRYLIYHSTKEKNTYYIFSRVKDALRVHSQPKVKFYQNFGTSRYNKNLDKLTMLKKSETYILYNNNAKKLLGKFKKIIIPWIIKRPILLFVTYNFIDFF